MSLSEKN